MRPLAAVCAIVMGAGAAAQTPTFRSSAATVGVNASVKRGNNVVANLKAADFQLTDNGVPQTIDAIAIESVPIDVTLFLDTSGSTAGKLDEMTHDVQAIVAMLRRADRFRLLTIGDGVNETVPWAAGGTRVNVAFEPIGGISVIHDALMFGLLHPIEPGRRHLVVGMTDRRDCGSVIPVSLLVDVASRSEAVMHLVDYSGGGEGHTRLRGCTPRAAPGGPELIAEAAERTGGQVHTQSRFFRAHSVLGAFKSIFDEFRQSYVLTYRPAGVDPHGWHAIAVTVPGVAGATVHARQGYYGTNP
jgi:hypothetical protein